MEWLLGSVDPSRAHDIDMNTAWHGRFMVIAWAFVIPFGIFIARFAKVMPKQNWPQECDNRTWWHLHIWMQFAGAGIVVFAFWLILQVPALDTPAFWHRVTGYAVLMAMAMQLIAGGMRGTHGGPTHPAPDGSWHGDHYDMTPRRCLFERVHKCVGYLSVGFAVAAIFFGIWAANGPRWMVIVIAAWWIMLAVAFALLQRRGLAIDTYQAIWGIDSVHPGNNRKPIGFGIRRYQPIRKD
jgi:hypothetical protein